MFHSFYLCHDLHCQLGTTVIHFHLSISIVSLSDWWFSNRALCGWKVQVWNDSPFWAVSSCGLLLVYLPDFGPSSFVSLPPPVRQVSLQNPASKLSGLRPGFPIRWWKCPRPSGPSCRHLYSVIGACQWGALLELILRKGDPLVDLRGAVFLFGWPKVCLIPSYIPLMLPVSAADHLRAEVKPGLHISLAACGSEALQVEHVYWDRLCMLTRLSSFQQ